MNIDKLVPGRIDIEKAVGFRLPVITKGDFEAISLAIVKKAEPLIRQDERERIFNWMSEPCPHTGGLEEQQLHKSGCPQCWQALKATEGKDKRPYMRGCSCP